MSIEVKDLSFSYGARPVLQQVSFSVEKGALLSVLGPNGVGKSTLFRCMLGLLRGYTGHITVDGRDIEDMSAKELARRVAYIPQSHYPSFNYTVLDMVLMGTSSQLNVFSPPKAKETAIAMQALDRMGIADFAKRYYTHISGGERQLVLIARALAQQAPVLIMDEPTANLDYGNQLRVLTQIRELAQEGYTILQSTHNPDQAYLFSHQILAIQKGEVVAHGAPGEVLDAQLMKTLYNIDVEVERLCEDRFQVCVPKSILKTKEVN